MVMVTRFKTAVKLFIIFILLLFGTIVPVAANPPRANQQQENKGAIYTVQPGDTLISIALKYNLSLAEIVLANDLLNPSLIYPGQRLFLPNVIVTVTPESNDPLSTIDQMHTVQLGDTIVTVANDYKVATADLILLNRLYNPNVIHVGQRLQIPNGPLPEPAPPDYPFKAIQLSEPATTQGRTLVIKIIMVEPAHLSGSFLDQPLRFYEAGDLQYWSIVAVHALLDPNNYPLKVVANFPDGREAVRIEDVNIVEGPYGAENIHLDGSRSELLQPELVEAEREKLIKIWSQVSPYPRWEGPFWYPVAADTFKITSYFGTRRYYNNSSELSFHGGTDFGGTSGTPIYTPAAGTVVLAERLTVRGNAVLIDHGLGLYSGYWHQSQIAVTEGQEVQRGDLIGYMGNTGLVTGPHLHWELRLNGIAVNPLQWVRESIP